MIRETFTDLRSSQGAFDLLQKFKNVPTLDEISKNLQQKYSEVLKTYDKEVVDNTKLFRDGKEYI